MSPDIGSVAIKLVLTLVEKAKAIYMGIKVQYQIDTDEERLLSSLDFGTYQAVILLHPLEKAGYESEKYFSEGLPENTILSLASLFLWRN